jgi:L-ribulose-5-phosphate 3-epimerase
MFRLGYNTNGFAHHTLEDTCAILAEIGYCSIALTVERDMLVSMDAAGIEQAAKRLFSLLNHHQLRCTIETGSRFFLDPWRKHQPTLISADSARRAARINFLKACVDLAARLGAESVSLWSGAADDKSDEEVLRERLHAGLREVLAYAQASSVRLSFEPEPGMFIDRMDKFERLHDELSDSLFGLTLDVGHVHCLGDGDAAKHIRRWHGKLWNVHIEDMRRGLHEHLMFGEGEMQFAPIIAALREVEYGGPLHVELSRHSHNAVEVARKAFEFLSRF